MSKSFVQSVLSTQKQRQRFYWIRNFVALCCAAGAFKLVGGSLGAIAAAGALLGGYFTVAPLIAFAVCLFEQMNS
jgi:hypothetical protein